LTLGWFGQVARLQGDHRSPLGTYHFSCGFRCCDIYITADDQSVLASECQGGWRPTLPPVPVMLHTFLESLDI
jgi:hypothetical protein